MDSALTLFGGLFVLLSVVIQAVQAAEGVGWPKSRADMKQIAVNVGTDWKVASWGLAVVGAGCLFLVAFQAARR